MEYILIVSLLLGPLLHFKVAASYHFIILGIFIYIILNFLKNNSKIKLSKLKQLPMLRFIIMWSVYSIFSLIWSVDKTLTLKYSYNIGLLLLLFLVVQYLVDSESKFYKIANFMVFILAIVNLIGVWEIVTGNHIMPNYLDNPVRLRLLKYTPGGFFMNPNDNATYIFQLLPFSMLSISNANKKVRLFAKINMVLSPVIIAATGSRTILILFFAILIPFILKRVSKISIKRTLITFISLTIILIIFVKVPIVNDAISNALSEIRITKLLTSVKEEGESGNVRINLTLNSIRMMIDTYGFGVGAGNHRVLMPDYSSNYYYTGSVSVAHNLLAELLADYGIFIFILFIFSVIKSIKILKLIYRNGPEKNQKTTYILMVANIIFVVAAIGSSSIIQIPTLWILLALTNVYQNINLKFIHRNTYSVK